MKDFLLIKYIDKANHFIIGYLIYFIFSILIGSWWAILPLVAIDFVKEYWDVIRHRMVFDWKDFFYTLAGSIPCIILNIIK